MNLDDKNRQQFGKWAAWYDTRTINRWYFNKLYARVIQQLHEYGKNHLHSGGTFLDVACGTGEIIFRLTKEFSMISYTGLDLTKEMIEKAKKKTSMFSNIHFQVGNAKEIPFENDHFDIVLCSEAFHHFSEPQRVASEFSRVLKPGGFLMVVDPVYDTWWQKILVWSFASAIESFYQFYSSKKMIDLFSAQKLTLVHGEQYFFNTYYIFKKVNL